MKYKVLIVDGDPLIRMALEEGLTSLGYQTRSAADASEGLELAEQFLPHAVLLDDRTGTDADLDRVAEFKRIRESGMVILMTACGSVARAVEAMKMGASDYLQKPVEAERVDGVIRGEMNQLSNGNGPGMTKLRPHKVLGYSPAIVRIREDIKVLAENDNVDVLIYGETGAGKEVVVNSIHSESARRNRPLVKINCSAIPENLLESELFGYEKGAFTGASKTKKGLMELADGGTIFLDEIGEMPLFMQTKLLTFLEDRCFKRVGGLRDIEVDVRVVAATNRDLKEAVARGTFREDLYYRLNVMELSIPPLRERREDIPVLCQFYMEHYNHKFGKSVKGIHPNFLERLTSHDWKGNVRELRNVMERSVLFAQGEQLTGEGFVALAGEERRPEGGGLNYPMLDLTRGTVDLRREVRAFERAYIDRALELSRGNLSRAAQMLGCTRFTLKRRLEEKEM